jgi:hypothetical protein
MQAANFCFKHGSGWAFPWRNRGSALRTKMIGVAKLAGIGISLTAEAKKH